MKNKNFIKFLGTAGARFVMIKQLRASGGIWLRYKSTNILIDPGPGSLVRCSTSRPKLDPASLDAIILTHKHLDHSGDINVMIEAMTEGGFKQKGIVLAPADALGQDGVIFNYLRQYPQEIRTLDVGEFTVGELKFSVPLQHIHSVQTYGLKFFIEDNIISFISDTKYFEGIIDAYDGTTLLILNVVFHKHRDEFQHLCLEDALKIIGRIKPSKAILTHFGMSILKEKPHYLEEKIRKQLGRDIKFAYDGLTVDIPT